MTAKKKFLKSYLLQEAQINRLNKMAQLHPQKQKCYLKQISECQKRRDKVEEKISAIDDEILREILMRKYIFGKTLEEISFIINYSKRHTERLHVKALQLFKI